MANDIAYAALFSSPLLFFVIFKIYPPVLASALSLMIGYLFLPSDVGVDLPLLPEFDKEFITVFCVALFVSLEVSKRQAVQRRVERGLQLKTDKERPKVQGGLLPQHPVAVALIVLFFFSAIMTGLTNADQIVTNSGVLLPGYTVYSTLSLCLDVGVTLMPFLLGRKLFAHPESQKTLLAVLAICMFGYSAFALFEIRMSPQLHNWVYGFHPYSFIQAMRDGGFRPSVFLTHGLWLALLNAMAIIAAIGAYRARVGSVDPKFWLLVAGWLFLVLAISNSLGAFLLAIAFVPVALFFSTRAQPIIAACIGLVILVYPALRERGLVPVETVVNLAENVNESRAQSLAFRFENEQDLLDLVSERPLAGWGGYGRGMLWNEWTGEASTIVDGYWIIAFSIGGYLRYIAEYGLLTFAFFQILIRGRKLDIGPETAILTILATVNLIDMIPNGTATIITWVIAGGLVGRIEILRAEEKKAAKANIGPIRGGRMRHRAAAGARAAATDDAVNATPAAMARTDAHSRLENAVQESRGDQYSRFRQIHSRALRDDPVKTGAKQNFRRSR